jgi:hypothetical protein
MEDINLVLQLVDICLFAGYGLYTFVWIVVSSIYKNRQFINDIDKSANYIAAVSGLIYFTLWIAGLYVSLNDTEQGDHLRRRLNGPYAFGYWLPPVLLFVSSQLLWIPFVQKQKLLRLIVGLLLFLSIEKFVIITISLHRDYLPSSWMMYQSEPFGNLIFFVDFTVRIIIYVTLSWACYFIYKNIKKKKATS